MPTYSAHIFEEQTTAMQYTAKALSWLSQQTLQSNIQNLYIKILTMQRYFQTKQRYEITFFATWLVNNIMFKNFTKKTIPLCVIYIYL